MEALTTSTLVFARRSGGEKRVLWIGRGMSKFAWLYVPLCRSLTITLQISSHGPTESLLRNT